MSSDSSVSDFERDDLHREVMRDIRFEYDPWGNLITKTSGSRQTQRFDFDAEGRLIRVRTDSSRGQIETSFDYDALGRRIGRIDKHKDSPGATPYVAQLRFVWQGLRLAQEMALNIYLACKEVDVAVALVIGRARWQPIRECNVQR